jgi:hypothetical protein
VQQNQQIIDFVALYTKRQSTNIPHFLLFLVEKKARKKPQISTKNTHETHFSEVCSPEGLHFKKRIDFSLFKNKL